MEKHLCAEKATNFCHKNINGKNSAASVYNFFSICFSLTNTLLHCNNLTIILIHLIFYVMYFTSYLSTLVLLLVLLITLHPLINV